MDSFQTVIQPVKIISGSKNCWNYSFYIAAFIIQALFIGLFAFIRWPIHPYGQAD